MMLVVDIGGTNIRMAWSDGTSLSSIQVAPTPTTKTALLDILRTLKEKARSGRPVQKVVLGIAGMLDTDKRSLLTAPNIEGVVGPLAETLEEVFKAPVFLQNDAALGALGEVHAGAGVGSSIMAYVTIGTGVGGARVVHGSLDEATHGFEIGHQYLVVGEESRDVESLLGGKSVKERFNMHPKDITDTRVWDELAGVCAYALFNSIVHWSPDTVVLGGSMFGTVGIPIAKVKEELERINTFYPTLPKLTLGTLGTLAGLHGARIYGQTR